MRIAWGLAAVLIPLATGCAGPEKPPPAAAAPEPRSEVRETYRPPEDGRLTATQVERYLVVWQHVPTPVPGEAVRATPFAGRTALLGDVTESMAPDVKTAVERGWNPAEYLWVRERVLEAEAARMTAKLNEDVLAMLERTLADLRSRLAGAPDEGTRTLLSEQVAAFQDEAARVKREAAQREPDAVRANMRILEPFRGRLDAMRDQIDRVTAVASGVSPQRRPRETRTPRP